MAELNSSKYIYIIFESSTFSGVWIKSQFVQTERHTGEASLSRFKTGATSRDFLENQ